MRCVVGSLRYWVIIDVTVWMEGGGMRCAGWDRVEDETPP